MIQLKIVLLLTLLFPFYQQLSAQKSEHIRVIGFFTARQDLAHISFVHEANNWLDSVGRESNFEYDSTNDWDNLNADYLQDYDVVLFLDTRPDSASQREAFEKYMNEGGSWLGFHFSAFALTPSAYPQNWDWYHNEFLGSGQYMSNTWRPTSAMLRVENNHPVLAGIPATFPSAPNEWYRWEKDLRSNKNIAILLAIDSSSFPLGTGPKQHEIWRNGYFPVAWTNNNYNMIYMNMGHNDMDYEHKTNAQLSSTFSSREENKFIINAIKWLAKKENNHPHHTNK